MQKYLVLYMMHNEGLAEWAKTPEAERKAVEDRMKAEWDAWAKVNKANLKESAGAGKTVRIKKEGPKDVGNDVMMYSFVEAESKEAVTKMFEGHPHLGIPDAWIDIMPANVIPGMADS